MTSQGLLTASAAKSLLVAGILLTTSESRSAPPLELLSAGAADSVLDDVGIASCPLLQTLQVGTTSVDVPSFPTVLAAGGVATADGVSVTRGPHVVFSPEVNDLLSSEPGLRNEVDRALQRVLGLFAGDVLDVALDKEDTSRVAISISTSKSPECTASALNEFDDWWIDHRGPGRVDVWVRHV